MNDGLNDGDLEGLDVGNFTGESDGLKVDEVSDGDEEGVVGLFEGGEEGFLDVDGIYRFNCQNSLIWLNVCYQYYFIKILTELGQLS